MSFSWLQEHRIQHSNCEASNHERLRPSNAASVCNGPGGPRLQRGLVQGLRGKPFGSQETWNLTLPLSHSQLTCDISWGALFGIKPCANCRRRDLCRAEAFGPDGSSTRRLCKALPLALAQHLGERSHPIRKETQKNLHNIFYSLVLVFVLLVQFWEIMFCISGLIINEVYFQDLTANATD